MRKAGPSRTALQVALWRALADIGFTNVPGFVDRTARVLLPPPWSWFLTLVERNRRQGKSELHPGLRHGADLLALRTLIIDADLKQALAAGARQLVILGAGLDGRAHRLPELSSVHVFEVDHPGTQDYKKRRAQALTTTAERLTYVAVDFERDSLAAALEAQGHDRSQPTVWIWEGVVMYLTDAALRATLHTIAQSSAPGSTLILNYLTRSQRRGAIKLLLRLWREPQISEHTPHEIAEELAAAGLRVFEDSGVEDWARRFHASLAQFAWSPPLRVAAAHVR